MKKFGITIGLLLCVMLFSSPAAYSAGWGYYDCTVEQVGAQDPDRGYIVLSDAADTPEFTDTRFDFHTSLSEWNKNVIIAAALTALATDKEVKAYMHPDYTNTLLLLVVKRTAD